MNTECRAVMTSSIHIFAQSFFYIVRVDHEFVRPQTGVQGSAFKPSDNLKETRLLVSVKRKLGVADLHVNMLS